MMATQSSYRIVAYITMVALVGLLGPTRLVAGDDKIKDMLKGNGTVEIKVIEAHVPDLDPLPMQQDSDVFVRVYFNASQELVCETQIIQDENKPKFNKDCRTTKPISPDTMLRFEVYDSDRPAQPDWIGMTRIKISDVIMNRKLDSKEVYPIEGQRFPKHYLRLKIDFKPEK